MIWEIAIGMFLGWMLIASYYGVVHSGWFAKDSTDGEKRSGLIILRDYGTGVEYVVNSLGGMSVRVGADGKPLIETDGGKQ